MRPSIAFGWIAATPLVVTAFETPLERATEQRHRRIEIEAKELGVRGDWAGSYVGGLGYVTLAPLGGFACTRGACLAPLPRQYGSVTEYGERLLLATEGGNESLLGSELMRFRWGLKRYLLPTRFKLDFCNEVNAAINNPNSDLWGALVRVEDRGASNGLATELPRELQPFVFEPALEPTIVFVGDPELRKLHSLDRWTTTMVLDVGTAERVWVGLEFHVMGRRSVDFIEVTDVAEHSCTVDGQSIGEPRSLPQVGDRVSTDLSHCR